MLATAPSWASDVAVVCGAVVALIAMTKAVTGWSPFKFVWKRLVIIPVREGLRSVVQAEVTPMLTDIHKELTFNGGSSVKDRVHLISARFDDLEALVKKNNHPSSRRKS